MDKTPLGSFPSSVAALCPLGEMDPLLSDQEEGVFSASVSVWLFPLSSDTNTVVGLPRPIHESIRTLKLVSAPLTGSPRRCLCVRVPLTPPAS